MDFIRNLTPVEFKFFNEIKNNIKLANESTNCHFGMNWNLLCKINAQSTRELKALLGIEKNNGMEKFVEMAKLLGINKGTEKEENDEGYGIRLGQSSKSIQLFHGNGKMVNGLVLRLDNYEEETIIIMYSPDLPPFLPIFAIFSIAFKFGQIPKIGQWFQLHIEPQQFSMDRLQQYLCSHNFPFMECRHPPQPLKLIDSPIWPISRVKNGKVQLLIDFKIHSILPEIGPIWCRAENFPSIEDTEGMLRKIICTNLGMAGKLEAKLKMSGWCELRKFKFDDSDWKIASIVKVKIIK